MTHFPHHTPYERRSLDERRRIDTCILVGEVDRLLGNVVYPQDDKRNQCVDDGTLDERIDYLRNLYAEDMCAEEPKYNWDNKRFEEIKARRAYEIQENLIKSGRVDGRSILGIDGESILEALIDKLDAVYIKPPVVIQHR